LKEIEGIKVSMFADDVVIWSSTKNNNKQQKTLEKIMNHSLEVLNSLAAENTMLISKSNTMYQFFSL
jgi:predicted solute-binding protein